MQMPHKEYVGNGDQLCALNRGRSPFATFFPITDYRLLMLTFFSFQFLFYLIT